MAVQVCERVSLGTLILVVPDTWLTVDWFLLFLQRALGWAWRMTGMDVHFRVNWFWINSMVAGRKRQSWRGRRCTPWRREGEDACRVNVQSFQSVAVVIAAGGEGGDWLEGQVGVGSQCFGHNVVCWLRIRTLFRANQISAACVHTICCANSIKGHWPGTVATIHDVSAFW
ncbi:hypothetical protein UPYG_G00044340 [Umbra pygmaea]|uniref:Uncharacterized protein n=1 Tax=Umbra pygmaea TaxID=75934 RepID=A0ABD0Y680_UMBPY